MLSPAAGIRVTDAGLRFGPEVPIEVIALSAPQLNGPDADQYEVIDHKITRRLAQRPGSYVVLEYRRPVLRHKPSTRLMEVPAPSAVFEGSLADVSLLAGLLVDKSVRNGFGQPQAGPEGASPRDGTSKPDQGRSQEERPDAGHLVLADLWRGR